MTLLIMCLALYGLGTLVYQVTGIIIDAVALVRKANKAADSLINTRPVAVGRELS